MFLFGMIASAIKKGINDSFTRTNAVSLGVADSGQAWIATKGTFTASGTNATSADAASNNSISSINMGTQAVNVSADVSGGTGVVWWLADASNWWAAYPLYDFSTASVNVCDQGYQTGLGNTSTCCSGATSSTSNTCSGYTTGLGGTSSCVGSCGAATSSTTSTCGGYASGLANTGSCNGNCAAPTSTTTSACGGYTSGLANTSSCNGNCAAPVATSTYSCSSYGANTCLQGSVCVNCDTNAIKGPATLVSTTYACNTTYTTTTTYACYTTYTASTTYACYTAGGISTVYACYTANRAVVTTTYSAKIIVVADVAGVISTDSTTTVATSTSAYPNIGSINVDVSGSNFTVTGYASAGKTTPYTGIARTPTTPNKGVSVGIIKAVSTTQQGSVVDNFSAQ